MASSDVKVANAIVTIVPTMEGARSKIAEEVSDSLGGVGTDPGERIGDDLLDGIGGKLSGKLGPLLAGALSVASVAAVSKALLDVGAAFDDMTDNIIVGTGASGAALEDLQNAARTVATTLPVSFGDAGQTVADLNTRLGLTGDQLTDLATKVSALDSFTGQATDINTLSGAMTAFGVSAEDISGKLDYFWGVSQATGVSMNSLFKTMQANAPQLTGLGFTAEEAANMVGLLDKAGIDANGTLSTMARALVNLSEPGQSASDAFQGVLDSIAQYIEAGDQAAAIDLASTVFGTRGATKFVAAVSSGALSLDALRDSALGASGSIMGTMEATMDWPERFEVIKNQLMAIIEPLASALFEGLGGAMDSVSAAIAGIDVTQVQALGATIGEAVATVIPALVDFAVSALPVITEGINALLPPITGILSATGPLLPLVIGIGGAIAPLIPAVVSLATGVPAIGAALGALAGPAGIVIGLIGAATAGVIGLWNTNEDFRNGVISIWEGVKDGIWSALLAIDGFFGNLGESVGAVFDSLVSNAVNFGQGLLDFWGGIPDRIIGFFAGIGNAIMGFFENIKLPHFHLHGSINPLDWPSQGLPGISVEWYAKGGIFNAPTIAGIGEAGPEAVLPLNQRQLQPVGDAVADSLGADALVEVLEILREIRDKQTTIVMDTGELVGATINATDNGLGDRAGWAGRGVAYA